MRGESAFGADIAPELHSRLDAAVAKLAERQHGAVSRAQLLALPMGAGAVKHRLASGRLHEVHRGVYAVGHPVISLRGRWMAAVLAAGPGAVLSHRAAAALWGLRGGSAIEVTTPRHCRRPGIVVHRATLQPDETTMRAGIPVTTVARTLFDMAAVLPRADVEAAFHESDRQHRFDVVCLDALVARYPGHRGTATIKRILEEARLTIGITRSELETAFQAFIDGRGLPRPHRNYVVLGEERDCVWPAHRVIVELDSWDTHGTRRSFERDRLRDRDLVLAGWRPLRVTYRHIVRDGERLERDLRRVTR